MGPSSQTTAAEVLSVGDENPVREITKREVPSSLVHGLRGVLSLVFRAGEGISALAGRVHLQFSHLPGIGSNPVDSTLDYAPLPYRIVNGVFSGLRKLTQDVEGPSDVRIDHAGVQKVRGVLNGIVGDRLEEWGNPLASPMRLVDRAGDPIQPGNQSIECDVVIFLHGLCMTHRAWEGPGHRKFLEDLRTNGYRPLWLNYNTGRAIPDNGRDLQNLLTRLSQSISSDASIVLIGHSMGGLLARSVFQFASQDGSGVVDRISRVAYLGSPHFGAPLERLGYHGNSLLGLLPVTRPFMSLGKLRGAGIRNLRYGRVRPDPPSSPGPIELPDGIDHLLVGSSINQIGKHTPLGDGLVPLGSSLGYEQSRDRHLSASSLRRVKLENVGHIELLGSDKVYSVLRRWLLNPEQDIDSIRPPSEGSGL